MVAVLLITLREGLEAALIIGIILSVLKQIAGRKETRVVWWGVGAALGVSLLVGIALAALGVALEGSAEEIFEGVAMLFAAVILTWMIFWMRKRAPHLRTEIETDVRQALGGEGSWALFSLAFVGVLREGVETAFFLITALFSSSPLQTLTGATLGLAAAVGLGCLIFVAGKRLNLRLFFQMTSILLLLVAAGLLAHGIHELQEAAVLPVVVEHVWDINWVLDEKGVTGQFLKALFGYNGNPSLLEVIPYALYVIAIGGLMGWTGRRLEVSQRQEAH